MALLFMTMTPISLTKSSQNYVYLYTIPPVADEYVFWQKCCSKYYLPNSKHYFITTHYGSCMSSSSTQISGPYSLPNLLSHSMTCQSLPTTPYRGHAVLTPVLHSDGHGQPYRALLKPGHRGGRPGHVEEPPLGQGGHAGADSGDPSGRTGVPRHKTRYIIGFMDSVRYWLLEIRSLC